MSALSGGIAVLVLAAGGGSRLGGGKLLLEFDGGTLVGRALELAAGVRPSRGIFVVIGHDAEAMRETLSHAAASHAITPQVVENPFWSEGQSTSLRRGIAAVQEAARGRMPDGIMVLLADQPLLRPETLSLLAKEHGKLHPAATAPVHEGRRGNPVILSPELFPEIMLLKGDTGARAILAGLGGRLVLVPVDDPGILRDVDTPDDYAAIRK